MERSSKDDITKTNMMLLPKRLISEQNKQWHEDKKTALMQKKNDIIRSLQQHRGPCQTPDDVDHLLQRFGLQQEHRAALQVEMNHHKVVLGV